MWGLEPHFYHCHKQELVTYSISYRSPSYSAYRLCYIESVFNLSTLWETVVFCKMCLLLVVNCVIKWTDVTACWSWTLYTVKIRIWLNHWKLESLLDLKLMLGHYGRAFCTFSCKSAGPFYTVLANIYDKGLLRSWNFYISCMVTIFAYSIKWKNLASLLTVPLADV